MAQVIEAKVERGLSAQRIYQDLKIEVLFSGSYESVKRFVRRLRKADPARVWRIEVAAGEEAQVDFGLGAPLIAGEGRKQRTWIFRIVLSYSRKAYSEAVLRQDTETFIRCLEKAFRHFGGVPRTLNLDNLKAAVLKADFADPELNPKLLEFARHYGVVLLPCLTSNRPIEEWGKLLNDVPTATAILDRFLHHAEIIQMTGRSYRLNDAAARHHEPRNEAEKNSQEKPAQSGLANGRTLRCKNKNQHRERRRKDKDQEAFNIKKRTKPFPDPAPAAVEAKTKLEKPDLKH